MLIAELADQLTARLTARLPAGLDVFKQELQHHTHAVVHGMAAQWDLVTQDEFVAQKRLLAQTQAQLTQLESQIQTLLSTK